MLGRFILLLHLFFVNPDTGRPDYEDDYYDDMTWEECTNWVQSINPQTDGIWPECIPQYWEHVNNSNENKNIKP